MFFVITRGTIDAGQIVVFIFVFVDGGDGQWKDGGRFGIPTRQMDIDAFDIVVKEIIGDQVARLAFALGRGFDGLDRNLGRGLDDDHGQTVRRGRAALRRRAGSFADAAQG